MHAHIGKPYQGEKKTEEGFGLENDEKIAE